MRRCWKLMAVASAGWAPFMAGCVLAESASNQAAAADELFRIRDGRAMRVSSSDPDWRNGNADSRKISPGVREIRVGMVDLAAGEHTLAFECKGRNPAARSCWLGVDVLTIDQITPYAVPGEKK